MHPVNLSARKTRSRRGYTRKSTYIIHAICLARPRPAPDLRYKSIFSRDDLTAYYFQNYYHPPGLHEYLFLFVFTNAASAAFQLELRCGISKKTRHATTYSYCATGRVRDAELFVLTDLYVLASS